MELAGKNKHLLQINRLYTWTGSGGEFPGIPVMAVLGIFTTKLGRRISDPIKLTYKYKFT